MRKLSLFLIPLLFVFLAFFLSQSRGPHWLGSVTDPDYAYLFNSLSLIQGTPIAHLDHPGTPVQILGQFVIRTAGLLTDETNLVRGVIINPEFYLNSISAFFTFLIFCSLSLLGFIVYRLTGKLFLALFLQLTPLISLALFGEPLTKTSTEPLILLSGIIFLIALSIFYYSNRIRDPLIIFCLALGLGTATKLTFFPLIVIPFLAFKSFKEKITLILGAAFFFFIFTTPIISSYPRLWLWIKALFIHSGRNAEGSATIVDFGTLIPNLLIQISSEPLFFSVVVIEALILIACVSKRYFKKRFLLLLGIFIAQSSQIFLVAKHPGASYLGPPLTITLLAVIILLDTVKDLKIFDNEFRKDNTINKILTTLVIIILMIGVYKISEFNNSLLKLRNEQMAVVGALQNEFSENLIIRHHRNSSVIYALKFGNTFTGNNFTEPLNDIYPDTYFWDIWGATFSGWDSNPVSIDKISKLVSENPGIKSKQIILTGTSFEDHYSSYPKYKPAIDLVNVYPDSKKTIEKETIYIYRPTTNLR